MSQAFSDEKHLISKKKKERWEEKNKNLPCQEESCRIQEAEPVSLERKHPREKSGKLSEVGRQDWGQGNGNWGQSS